MFLKEFIKLNVNIDMIIQKREKCKIKNNDCEWYLQYRNVKVDLLTKKLNEDLKKQVDINNFIMMLPKGACPYDYMDDWGKC